MKLGVYDGGIKILGYLGLVKGGKYKGGFGKKGDRRGEDGMIVFSKL